MPIIGLSCANVYAAVDSDLGCGLLGLWRSSGERRAPVLAPAPFPDTTPAELLAAWPSAPVERSVPVTIVHRTPLSISWRWDDGAAARWELGPDRLHASWSGLTGVDFAARLGDNVTIDASEDRFALHIPPHA